MKKLILAIIAAGSLLTGCVGVEPLGYGTYGNSGYGAGYDRGGPRHDIEYRGGYGAGHGSGYGAGYGYGHGTGSY